VSTATGQLARTEVTLVARSAGAVVWTALAPVVALIVLGSIPAVGNPSKSLHGLSYLDAYLPILMIFSLCMSTINILPPTLAGYREKGILRRLSTTPVSPSRMLAVQAAIYLCVALLVSMIMLIVAVTAYSVTVPHEFAGFVVALLLVAAASAGIGLVIAAVAPTAKAANAMSTALFFPLMFLAGLWVPRAQMPGVLRTISDYSPLGAGVSAVQRSLAGDWPSAQSLLVLVGYAVIFGAIAARSFRWE
jgi:ABC-2 type transport system permease protein